VRYVLLLSTAASLRDLVLVGEYFRLTTINTSNGIDAVLNVAVFAALVLCIVGFDAWAHTPT
jgi:hypothetical protein